MYTGRKRFDKKIEHFITNTLKILIKSMAKKLFLAALAAAALAAVSCSKDNESDDSNVNNGSSISSAYDTITIDFSNLTLGNNSHWNGSDNSGKFVATWGDTAAFLNGYTDDPTYPAWGGFAYSNQNDTSISGLDAQFDVYTTSPSDRGTYAIGYYTIDFMTFTPIIPTITFSKPVALQSADFALNVYAYKSMKYGDEYAKQFTTGDWCKITIKNVDSSGVATDSAEVYLADFRNGKSSLVDGWTNVSLASLGTATKLTFEISSTDNGTYGMNTPAYFCLDNMVVCAPKKD
jgi:hypothetical protein